MTVTQAKARRRRWVLLLPALVGVALCVHFLTRENPPDALTVLSGLLVVPFLASFDLLGVGR